MTRYLPIVLLLLPSFVYATQDLHASTIELSQRASFEIRPTYFTSQKCYKESSCNEPVYKGEISIGIKLKEKSKYLSRLKLKINGKKIPIKISNKLRGRKVFLHELSISHSPGYLPLELRKEIVGLGPPYINITGILFMDKSCDEDLRELSIHYKLEIQKVEIRDRCVSE